VGPTEREKHYRRRINRVGQVIYELNGSLSWTINYKPWGRRPIQSGKVDKAIQEGGVGWVPFPRGEVGGGEVSGHAPLS
jgi:hypothetical protein